MILLFLDYDFYMKYCSVLLCMLLFLHIISIFFYVLLPSVNQISIHISAIKILILTLEGFTNTFLRRHVENGIHEIYSSMDRKSGNQRVPNPDYEEDEGERSIPHSSDLAPSDYHFFGPLQDILRHFPDNSELKKNVREAFKSQSKDFYRTAYALIFQMGKSLRKKKEIMWENNDVRNKD